MMNEPSVSIIVLNFNGKDLLHDCLRSLLKLTYSNVELIVVDNGSTDQSDKMLKEQFPGVQVLQNSRNLGFSKGNNTGILRSSGDFIVLLNNDTTVQPNWLTEMVQAARQEPECFYQPKILLAESKKMNSAGNRINLFGFAYPQELGEDDSQKDSRVREISYASGACVLADKRLISDVGLLDEADLFAFYEDVNWGWRALMLGYKSKYVPSAVVYHRWGGTWGSRLSPSKLYLIERGRLATIIRNYSYSNLVSMLPSFILVEFFVLLYSSLSGLMSAKIASYADVLRNLGFILNQKKALQSRRTSPDSAVVASFSTGFRHVYFGSLSTAADKVMNLISGVAKSVVR